MRSQSCCAFPKIEKTRYYDVQIVDMYTFNYGYIGSRTTGNDAGCFMVAGPDRKGDTLAGIKKVFHSETQFGLVGYRTQLFGPKDMPNVVKVQAGYMVQPLSAFAHQPAPPAAPAINFPPFTKEGMKTPFASYLNFILQFCPPVDEDKHCERNLRRLELKLVSPSILTSFPRLTRRKWRLASRKATNRFKSRKTTSAKNISGWLVGSALGRPCFLPRQLAPACCDCVGGHLWQQRGGGGVRPRKKRFIGQSSRWQ